MFREGAIFVFMHVLGRALGAAYFPRDFCAALACSCEVPLFPGITCYLGALKTENVALDFGCCVFLLRAFGLWLSGLLRLLLRGWEGWGMRCSLSFMGLWAPWLYGLDVSVAERSFFGNYSR